MTAVPPGTERDGGTAARGPLRLHTWSDPAVVAVAFAALAGGMGQFGAVAALGDVARAFGQVSHGATVADQAGLSGTVLGVGLAVIRLASLGGLPVAGMADRFGRRRILLITLATGLTLTALAAASPGYWWFVAIFACGRPLLSGADAVIQVTAAEHTGKDDRAKAIALAAAGYGVGAGFIAVLHGLASGVLGFRGLMAVALLPVGGLLWLRRRLEEPDRFTVSMSNLDRPVPILGAVGLPYRRRLGIVTGLAFAISVITGPANGFVFLYADNILHQPGYATAAMVVGAGASGLVGLILGQMLADRVGRRWTGSLAMIGIALCGLLAYSGSTGELDAGYIIGVGVGSILAPAAGAMLNELFPTSVRASVAGWWIAAGVAGAATGLVLFGAVSDVGGRFGAAAAVTFLPAAAAAGLFWLLPETRGLEPEQLEGGGRSA
ncbi:MAG TPA: MFS transporter [Acidimicrobiales bacterium]|nr:MFS transporter [Acidimicrobiales bacterium]